MPLELPFDVARWPDWAIPAIGGGCAVLVLGLGYLIFGRKKSRRPLSWQEGPLLRSRERQIVRANEAPRGSDQRGTVRRTGNPVDIHVTDEKAREPPRPALVLDRSLRGLCVAIDEPHEVGAILSVRPARDNHVPWVKVKIKNCRPVGKGYELGCEFIEVPPANILMMFG